jgi:hypothetical protein
MICAYDQCDNEFTPKTHNQKYCSDECCRIATNQKLKDAYYEKKERLAGKKRTCKGKNCNTLLSRYQEDNICSLCKAKEETKKRQDLLDMVRRVSG